MRIVIFLLAASSTLAATASATDDRKSTAPSITYWMSAETSSGFTAGQPGGGTARSLQLQLGSPRRPTGMPSAAHFPPSSLGAGPSLPLTSPRPLAATAASGRSESVDPSALKSKMIIYWGCGERARQHHPVIVDLASLASGKSSGLAGAITAAAMNPPAPGRHATYGDWPNADGRTTVPASGSLVGDHVVRGNYSPELRFAVQSDGDFLAALQPRITSLTSGAVKLSWTAVSRARATFAAVMGASGDGTMVLWSSSEVKLTAMALPDYLGPTEIARLLAARALLAPEQTECTVPAEVVKAGGMTLQMTAYGPETNLRSPTGEPWTVKLRTRSTHMGMLKADVMEAAVAAASGEAESQKKPKKKRGLLRGLGSALGAPLPLR